MIRRLSLLLMISTLALFTAACTPDDGRQEGSNPDQGRPVAAEDVIGIEKAGQIALERVPGATEDNIVFIEEDTDDGHLTYEGEIVFEGTEYEFEISADDGAILEWEIDRD